jgi:hypothetical protein
LKPRILDPRDFCRGSQDEVRVRQRAQNDVASLLSTRQVDVETGERSAGESMVRDARLDHSPQRAPICLVTGRLSGERKRERNEQKQDFGLQVYEAFPQPKN